jgi:hypothetical protein
MLYLQAMHYFCKKINYLDSFQRVDKYEYWVLHLGPYLERINFNLPILIQNNY